MTAYRTNRSGFTLVEILIVVIILGILAAIVIPQFTNASTDARRSSLQSMVQTLRSQIELYKLQHNDKLPDLITDWSPFTSKTNAAGSTTIAAGETAYGPYLQTAPANQLVPEAGKSVVKQGTAATAPDGSAGFYYDYGTAGDGSGLIWGVDKTTTGYKMLDVD